MLLKGAVVFEYLHLAVGTAVLRPVHILLVLIRKVSAIDSFTNEIWYFYLSLCSLAPFVSCLAGHLQTSGSGETL
jgi:hypothetical protein